eukprot:g10757.t1
MWRGAARRRRVSERTSMPSALPTGGQNKRSSMRLVLAFLCSGYVWAAVLSETEALATVPRHLQLAATSTPALSSKSSSTLRELNALYGRHQLAYDLAEIGCADKKTELAAQVKRQKLRKESMERRFSQEVRRKDEVYGQMADLQDALTTIYSAYKDERLCEHKHLIDSLTDRCRLVWL